MLHLDGMNWKAAIKDYSNYLRLERGLSENTIENYHLDLKKLMDYLDENNIQDHYQSLVIIQKHLYML